MKIVIFGSRTINNMRELEKAIQDAGYPITIVISGGARGVDTLAHTWATKNALPSYVLTANWNMYGKRAGILRNNEMASLADAGIAVWDGASRGTAHMISRMEAMGKPVYKHEVRN